MSDLERMEQFYSTKDKNEWSIFNCFPFYIGCKQTSILIKILQNINLKDAKVLDIGAGEGDFLLKLITMEVKNKNITAVEYLKERYNILQTKLPNINAINDNYLNTQKQEYNIITIMAVLTSITDNTTRYNIFTKALSELSKKNGVLILYDYFDETQRYLTKDYRALSLKKIEELAKGYKITIYKKVYLNLKIAKGLCKLKLGLLIPFLELFKVFNANYHFVVIENER